MSNLIRWEPAREMMTLRDAMDRLFDDAFTRPLRMYDGQMSIPAVDMYQTDDEVVVKAAVPGAKADDVQINVTGEVLIIKGEIGEKQEVEEKAYHLREQRWGVFERTIALPTDVIADKAKAEFENGILTITLPKAEEVRPKTINIKTKYHRMIKKESSQPVRLLFDL
jgi:HSP20 family protein